jgi:hypothetical protein
MHQSRSRWAAPVLAIFTLALLAGGIWANLYLAETSPGGEEFLTYWNGLRSWMLRGTSPYNLAVQLDTELMAYGHPAQTGEPRLVFISPLYSALLLLPFALIPDYSMARAFWMITLELSLIATIILSARLLDWKPNRFTWALLVLFTWLGAYSIQSILSGSPAAMVGLFIVLALTALRNGRQELAGLLFALATSFPLPLSLLVIFILFWALISRKGLMAVWLVASVLIFGIIGFFFISDWLFQMVRSYIAFYDAQALLTSGDVLRAWLPGIGNRLGWGVMILVGLILLIEWILARQKDYRWLAWVVSLTLVLQIWSGVPFRMSYSVILLIPLVQVLASWEQRLSKVGKWLASGSLALLLVAGWLMTWGNIDAWYQMDISPLQTWGMILFLTAILVVGVYWVRWWSVRPRQTYVEKLRSSGY